MRAMPVGHTQQPLAIATARKSNPFGLFIFQYESSLYQVPIVVSNAKIVHSVKESCLSALSAAFFGNFPKHPPVGIRLMLVMFIDH